MAYRNGVYVAFNGCGTAVPTQSDIKWYNLLKAWHENKSIDFDFVNSHDKTCQVRDGSLNQTLISRLNERLANSKILLLIVTPNTKRCSRIVEHEIIRAVDINKIPIIVVYPEYEVIKSVTWELKDKLPLVLQSRIKDCSTKVLFIPFKQKAIKHAISQFGIREVAGYTNDVYCYTDTDNWNI